MHITYPKSFLKLLLIGFALAMLPLVFAFGNAALSLERLADQSRQAVVQAVQATRSSRLLVEQLTVMERSTRQYLVLNDRLLLNSYSLAHDKFYATVGELAALPLDQVQRHQLETLSSRENRLYQQVSSQPITKASSQAIIAEFVDLAELAQDILSANNRLIDHESATLAATAEHAQHVLLWQALTLLPVAILVAAAITFLVAQPIRRMDSAIRHLGAGEYGETIAIDGPGDIRTLGERLDWLRNQLLHLEEQKKRFLRHISHELKTPLTAIREGSELLADEVGGTLSPQQREIAAILRENSLRLQKMIENLLNYSAVEFQKPELKPESLNPAALLEQTIASYALTLERKKIRVTSHFSPVSLVADREKILTVLDNLFSNAMKFTPQGGTIELTLSTTGSHVIVDIHDSGPGIAKADRAHLFQPFYQGDSAYDGHVSGSGVGLSIAKEYVEAHGGRIEILPSKLGAHFRVTLPQQTQDITI